MTGMGRDTSMASGAVVVRGSGQAARPVVGMLVNYLSDPYTQALLSATPVADPTREQTRIRLEGELPSPLNPPKGCAFNPRCWKSEVRCRESAPVLESEQVHRVACYFPL